MATETFRKDLAEEVLKERQGVTGAEGFVRVGGRTRDGF
jgi:hypothetical protein